MTTQRKFSSATVFVATAAALMLGGCVTVNSAPQPDPTVSEIPEEPPIPESILIEGDAFTVFYDDGSEGERVAYSSEPQVAIDALTAAFATEPTLETVPELYCVDEHSAASWGDGLQLKYDGFVPMPADAQFVIEATADSIAGVALHTTGGFSVGDPTADLAASDPSYDVVPLGTTEEQLVYYGVVAGTPDGQDDYYGAYAYGLSTEGDTTVGLIDAIEAPVDFRWDC